MDALPADERDGRDPRRLDQIPEEAARIVSAAVGAVMVLAIRGLTIAADAGREALAPNLWPLLAGVAAVSCFATAVSIHNRFVVLFSAVTVQVFIFGLVIGMVYNDNAGLIRPGGALIYLPLFSAVALLHAVVWRWNIWPHTKSKAPRNRAS